MSYRRLLSLLLVIIMVFGQNLASFAYIGVNFSVNYNEDGSATVVSSVYSDNQVEAAGKTVSFQVFDESNNSLVINPANSVINQEYSSFDGVNYHYNLPGINFGISPNGGTYNVSALIDGAGETFAYSFPAPTPIPNQSTPDPVGDISTAGILPQQISFDKSVGGNVVLDITYNGNILNSMVFENKILELNKDYFINGNQIEIPGNFLMGIPLGYSQLIFQFSDGVKVVNVDINKNGDSRFVNNFMVNLKEGSKYIEFRTKPQAEGVPDVTTATNLRFELKGLVPEDMFRSSNIDARALGNVTLEKIGSIEAVPVIDTLSRLNMVNFETGAPERLYELNMVLGSGLEYDTTYRVNFNGPILDKVLENIYKYVYVDQFMDPENIILFIELPPDASGMGNMVDGRSHVNNPGITFNTPVTMKELGGEGSIGANGKFVSFDFDMSKGFSDVKKLGFFSSGNWPSLNNVDTSKDLSEFGSFGNVTTTYSFQQGAMGNSLGLFLNLPMPQNISDAKVTVSSYGNGAKEFVNAVTAYWWNHEDTTTGINYEDFNGTKYALVYNSNDEIIGWKAFDHNINMDKLYVNPKINWMEKMWDQQAGKDVWNTINPPVDTTTGFPAFSGMKNFDPQRFLTIENSGLNNMIMLNGSVTYYDDNSSQDVTNTFDVTSNTNWEWAGRQEIFLDFWNIMDQNFTWQSVRAQGQESNWFNNRIPVHPYQKNIITLTYNYQVNGVPYTGKAEFVWKPDTQELSNNILGHMNLESKNKIGLNPTKNSITFRMPDKFSGDISKLKLRLYYNGDITSDVQMDNSYQEGISVVTGTFSAVSKEEIYDSYGGYTNTYITFTYDEVKDVFSLGDVTISEVVIDGITHNNLTIAEYLTLAPMNKINQNIQLLYQDADMVLSRDSSTISSLEVDASVQNGMWANFKGPVENVENSFKLKIHFDEYIDVASLENNLEISMRDKDNTLHYANVTLIEGVHEDWQKPTDPYQNFIITFTIDKNILLSTWDKKLKIISVADYLGNLYVYNEQQPMMYNFNTDTRFQTALYDEVGNIITNAQLRLVQQKPVPSTDQNSWYDERIVQINNKGVLEGNLVPGNYIAYALSVMDDKGQWVERSIDLPFAVPFMDQENPYLKMNNINLPAVNVKGVSMRADGRQYKEKLMFISETDYAQYYSPLMVQMQEYEEMIKDPNYQPNPEQPKPDFYRALETIDRFYIKTVETDMDGKFGLYLDSKDSSVQYRLLGKKTGKGMFIKPLEMNPVFTVTTNGYIFASPIEFPPPALDGYLKDSMGNPVKNGVLEIHGPNGGYNVEADNDGYFAAYIDKVGEYNIVTICSGYEAKDTGRLSVFGATFEVVMDETNNYVSQGLGDNLGVNKANYVAVENNVLNLKVPAPNVTIKVGIGRDENNNLVQSGKRFYAIRINALQMVSGETPYYLQNIDIPAQNGIYELYIPEGTYKLNGLNSYDISIPSWNNASNEKYVTITEVGGSSQQINETVSMEGFAEFGGYEFTAENTTKNYEVDISGYFDTVLELKYDDGSPIANANVSIENISDFYWQNSNTGTDGKAYFYFGIQPDELGTVSKNFRVNGYDYNRKWYHFDKNPNYEFSVTSDNTTANKFMKTITILKPNFYGTVYKGTVDENNVPDPLASTVEYGWINIKKLSDGTNKEEWFGTGADSDGNFSTTFTQKGQYIIESVGSYDFWFEVGMRFDVVLNSQTGKYELVYPSGHELAGQLLPLPLNIGKQKPNFQGYLFRKVVYDDNNKVDIVNSLPYTGFDGTETWVHDKDDSGVNMVLVEAGISDEQLKMERWKYEKWIRVSKDGSFYGVLDPGKSYKVFAVSTPKRWTEFSQGIPVILGSQNIIYPPLGNFNGTVGTFDSTIEELLISGVKLQWGGIGLEKLGETNQWEWVDISEDGSFSKNLEVGATYRINDVNFELIYPSQDPTIKDRRQYNFKINKTITIGENPQSFDLRPNFKGLISGISINTTNLWDNQVGINLRKVIDPTDPSYDSYKMEPWKYEIWGNGKYNAATGEVEFTSFLEPGKYELLRVHDIDINEVFKLSEDITATASGDGNISYSNGQYTMTLNFASNVTGYVAKDGVAVPNPWLNMEFKSQDGTKNMGFGTKGDSKGNFALKLSDGNYRIHGYNTEGGWKDGTWQPGQWVQLSYEFKVINKKLCDQNGNPIERIILDTNVKGKVMKLDKSNPTGYSVVNNAWLQIWKTDEEGNIDWSDWSKSMWTNSNDSGEFRLALLPGKYKVTDAGGNNFYTKVDLAFEINESNELVAESNYIDVNGYFIVKPATPNLAGTVFVDSSKRQILAQGHMVVKPRLAKEDDWSNAKWINTDKNGSFNTVLSDGDWKIVEMGNWNTWMKVQIPFNVKGKVIMPMTSGMSVEANGSIVLYPPEPNVKGVVFDKQGNQLNDKGWITIKPADAGEHDWSRAVWTEYKFYGDILGDNKNQFRLNLEPGNYKVVEVGSMNMWYKTNIEFTVEEDLSISGGNVEADVIVVAPPAPNVTGVAFGTYEGEERPIAKGWINFARYNGGSQVTMEGIAIPQDDWKDPYSDVYWNHTIGVEIDQSGKFAARLPLGGTYRIVSVGGSDIWYQPNTEFTIIGSEVKVLEVKKPGPNVNIIVKDLPTEIASAQSGWIDIYQLKDGIKNFVPVTFKEKTEAGFVFEGYLKDGNYTVAYFGIPDGAGIELLKELVVSGNTTEEISIGNESSKAMVTGTVTRNGESVEEKVWVAITGVVNGETVKKKVQTNNHGEFRFKLPHGTIWTLTEIVTDTEGYIGVNSPGTINTINVGTRNDIQWTIEITGLN